MVGELSPEDLLILGAIDTLPAREQSAALRALALARASEVETFEVDYLETLRDSIHLAVQNLQDARLADIEVRLDKLENPPPPPWWETLTDALIIFLGELIIAETMNIGFQLLKSSNAARSSLRQIRLDAGKQAGKLESEIADLQRSRKTLMDRISSEIEKGRVSGTDMTAYRNANTALGKLENDLSNARARSSTASSVRGWPGETWRKFLDPDATDEQLAEAAKNSIKPNSQMGKFINSDFARELGATAADVFAGRAGETLGEWGADRIGRATAEKPAEAPPGTDQVFLTSYLANKLLTSVSAELQDGRSRAANVRNALIMQPESDLMEGDLVHQVLMEAKILREHTPVRAGMRTEIRDALVYASEAYLWFTFLSYCGYLKIDANQPKMTLTTADFEGDSYGLVFGSCQVTERKNSDDLVAGQGVYVSVVDYPYAPAIADDQAEYLFKRFAAVIIEARKSSFVLPPGYDPANYRNIRREAGHHWMGWDLNPTRTRRLNEMKILIVQAFFVQFDALRHNTQIAGIFGWLDQIERTEAPAPPSDQPLRPIPKPSDEDIAAASRGFNQFLEDSHHALGSTQTEHVSMMLEVYLHEAEGVIRSYKTNSSIAFLQDIRSERTADEFEEELTRALAALGITIARIEASGDEKQKAALDLWLDARRDRIEAVEAFKKDYETGAHTWRMHIPIIPDETRQRLNSRNPTLKPRRP